MTLRHLFLSLGAYATAFALAWSITWVLCELHPVNQHQPTVAGNTETPARSADSHRSLSDPR